MKKPIAAKAGMPVQLPANTNFQPDFDLKPATGGGCQPPYGGVSCNCVPIGDLQKAAGKFDIALLVFEIRFESVSPNDQQLKVWVRIAEDSKIAGKDPTKFTIGPATIRVAAGSNKCLVGLDSTAATAAKAALTRFDPNLDRLCVVVEPAVAGLKVTVGKKV